MPGHVHEWEPVPNHTGQYRCACGASGWRSRGGRIRPHKKPRTYREETVQDLASHGQEGVYIAMTPSGGFTMGRRRGHKVPS